MRWENWNLVLAPKEKGGIGIGSLASLNSALLQKWRWRFVNEPCSIWVQIISSLYGPDAVFSSTIKGNSVWQRMVKDFRKLHESGIVPFNSIHRQIGCGG
ncbi:hypothetical protein L1987_02916 [Smallanthus sonchifolius]|uniref:Uncharacterized protein n=1 Tax=Smallanthus sonchifolius TaxID=185202 RepID=A0ACB9K9A8_9ASTR|nr:hypothetical protein L1987_02916 [Smallanthus sonchifolius]